MTSQDAQTLNLGHFALTTDQRVQIRQSPWLWRALARQDQRRDDRALHDRVDRHDPANAHITTWIPVLVERLTDDRLRALMRLESTRTDLTPASYSFVSTTRVAPRSLRASCGSLPATRSTSSPAARCGRRCEPGGRCVDGREGHRHQQGTRSPGQTRSCERQTSSW